jgi:Tfp pilus assembly protein PilF
MLDLAAPDPTLCVSHFMPADEPLWAGFEQACAWQAQGQARQAQVGFSQLLDDAPAGHAVCAPSWANLGMVLEDQGELGAARRAYEQAIALDPSLYAPHLHLGQWWMHSRDPQAPALAEHWLQRAARLQPDAPGAWSSLGALLSCLRRDADAEACLRHAMALDPSYRGARFNLAYLCLRQGRWAEGWACLEARPTTQSLSRHLPWPRWAGEPLQGRRLLIVNDAGHGDLIHLWRYRPRLHALGAGEVAWMVQPPLIPLLQAQPGVGPLWSLEGRWPDGPDAPDVWAPLMSLPWLCGDEGDWPVCLPYLNVPDPASVATASPATAHPFTIGLVWHGSARHENDADRSLPDAALLSPVVQAARARGWRVLNLQPEAPLDLAEPGPHLGDFADVAQALQGIDLLVTVDTAYAHLAGALGRPVWVMLPHWKTDWRWLDARSDSPWYPGVMRLFRQAQRGDWAGGIDEVAQALAAFSPHPVA